MKKINFKYRLKKIWIRIRNFCNIVSEGIDKTQYKNGWGKL
jgi:hypothetical protein